MNFKTGRYGMKRLAVLLQDYVLCCYPKMNTLLILYDTYHRQKYSFDKLRVLG